MAGVLSVGPWQYDLIDVLTGCCRVGRPELSSITWLMALTVQMVPLARPPRVSGTKSVPEEDTDLLAKPGAKEA